MYQEEERRELPVDIVRISLLGLGGVMLSFMLKGTKPEYSGFVTMGVGILILSLAVGKLEYLFDSIRRIRENLDMDADYFVTLVKMLGITYIGQFSAGICRDAGCQATGAQIELFCKLSVMVLSMPVLLSLIETIQEFLT